MNEPMNEESNNQEQGFSDNPVEMDVKTGPGSIIGIIIIVVVILVAGFFVIFNRANAPTDEVTDQDLTPEAISGNIDGVQEELNNLDSELNSLETEFDEF